VAADSRPGFNSHRFCVKTKDREASFYLIQAGKVTFGVAQLQQGPNSIPGHFSKGSAIVRRQKVKRKYIKVLIKMDTQTKSLWTYV
jgi:hypothetical protein